MSEREREKERERDLLTRCSGEIDRVREGEGLALMCSKNKEDAKLGVCEDERNQSYRFFVLFYQTR